MDNYAVIKIAKDTAQEELKEITDSLTTTLYYGKKPPENIKAGDIFVEILP